MPASMRCNRQGLRHLYRQWRLAVEFFARRECIRLPLLCLYRLNEGPSVGYAQGAEQSCGRFPKTAIRAICSEWRRGALTYLCSAYDF